MKGKAPLSKYLNKMTLRGNLESWILCGAYLQYRKEGGEMGPLCWNRRVIELNRKGAK